MSLKKKEHKGLNETDKNENEKQALDVCDAAEINKLYSKKCTNNKSQLDAELMNREYLEEHNDEDPFLYPILDDPNFNIKIAQKKEFNDTKYDGSIFGIEDYAKVLSTAEYELLPQQAFVRNFLSFQTPYNSLLLFHGLGTGKCHGINTKILMYNGTIKNVQDGYFVPNTTDTLVGLPQKVKKEQVLETGDIILSLTGNVGRVCLVYGDNYLLNQRMKNSIYTQECVLLV